MNKTNSVAGLLLAILTLICLALSAIWLEANTQTAQAASGPQFNIGGKPFVIQRDQGGNINNVAGTAGDVDSYERNFLRLGDGWNVQGDYPGGGSRFEACEDGQIITLWVYAHNTIATRNNHLVTNDLDFKGAAIAHNTTVALEVTDLNDSVYKSEHQIQATIDADNATAVSDTAVIYCGDHEISLVSTGLAQPTIHTWANEFINRDRHQKAQEVFDSAYILSDPAAIFSGGSEFGYDGNLPACRYYAAYVQVQLKVVVEVEEPALPVEPEEPALPVEPTPIETPEQISPLGGSDQTGLNDLAMVAAAGVGLSALVGRHKLAVARARRHS